MTAAPAGAVRVVPVRHWGRWVAAVIVAALTVALVLGLAHAKIAYSTIPDYLHNHLILVGLRNTIIISVLAQAIGIALGVIFAVMRLSKNPVVSSVSWFYIWFFRGTPVLVQLVIWFNLALAFSTISIPIPFTGHFILHESMNAFMTPFMAALLGLGLNEGAYMAEIVRAGIISVDEGQSEAAAALGMTRTLTMRRVVLPQAMRVIIPPTGNEFINMLKTSSLAAIITYGELFQQSSEHLLGQAEQHRTAVHDQHLVPRPHQRGDHRAVLPRAPVRPRLGAGAACYAVPKAAQESAAAPNGYGEVIRMTDPTFDEPAGGRAGQRGEARQRQATYWCRPSTSTSPSAGSRYSKGSPCTWRRVK